MATIVYCCFTNKKAIPQIKDSNNKILINKAHSNFLNFIKANFAVKALSRFLFKYSGYFYIIRALYFSKSIEA